MIIHPEYDNLLQFESLNDEKAIQHFTTTRKGGVSKGDFSSFNLGNFSDDNPIDIDENRQILSRMWYMDLKDFIIPHQTHSSNVLVIDERFDELLQSDKIELLYGVDATITHLKSKFLCVTTADCVPILLYDKSREIVAAIHAGWRGIVSGIIEHTISKLIAVYQSNSADIVATIGPSITHKNYEVGTELIHQFEEAGFDLSSSLIINKSTNKPHIDLKSLSHSELVRLGVAPQHIETSDLCTYDRSDLFFSARRQSIHSGRMLSGIMLDD